MEMQEWEEKVKSAKCPDTWTDDLLGYDTCNGITDTELRFYPGMSNIDDINARGEEFCYAKASLYSHGINIYIEPNHGLFEHTDVFNYPMTNEQIVDIDLVPYDEYVKYKKSIGGYMSKGAAIAAVANTGMVGVAIGAAIGAVASIGNKTSHLKGKYLRITFWDRDTKDLRYILLDHPKQKELEKFVDNWKNEKKKTKKQEESQQIKLPDVYLLLLLLL